MGIDLEKIHKCFLININSSNQYDNDCNFERNHIFFDIFEKLSKVIKDDDEVIKIYFIFNTYQKSLDYARLNQPSIAKYWIDYCNSQEFELTELSKKSMKALYYPMISYYEYKIGNYEFALNYLEKSFPLLLELECKHQINEVFWARLEQYLNLSRIYFSKYDSKKAINIGCDLINYFLTKKNKSTLIIPNDKVLNAESANELYQTINYNIDSILRRIYSLKSDNQKALIFNFLENIEIYNSKNNFYELKQSIELLKKMLEKKEVSFSETIYEFFEQKINLRKTPSLVIYTILEEFYIYAYKCKYNHTLKLRNDIDKFYETVGLSSKKNIDQILEKEIRGLI